ncbi:hypothetical protein [Flexivirga sp. B27]
MFWIYFFGVFLVLCTALTLIVRLRGGGNIRGGTGVDNHNALQNAEAQIYRRHNQSMNNGPFN